ncbi:MULTISPECIES: hypothetical protein [Pseudomonas]|nr:MULTISPECIES: hypothetical protein [unclassified Pseudomonas]MED5606312.1 hypothetical protein [Pseudomonas sp. JH-2]
MSATQPQPNPRPAEPRDWPRDFDVRERYAEQQELLGAPLAPLRPNVPAR